MQEIRKNKSNIYRNFAFGFVVLSLLSGCADIDNNSPSGITSEYQPREQTDNERREFLTGSGLEGIVSGEGGVDPQWQVNGFLWRAALEVFSFLPMKSLDPLTGVIQSEWYQENDAAKTRYRVNVIVNKAALIPSALRVTVFVQSRDSKSSGWKAVSAKKDMVRRLENAVLTRARILRLAALDLQ